MWHVRSRSGVATLRTAVHLLLTYLPPPCQRASLTARRSYMENRVGRSAALTFADRKRKHRTEDDVVRRSRLGRRRRRRRHGNGDVIRVRAAAEESRARAAAAGRRRVSPLRPALRRPASRRRHLHLSRPRRLRVGRLHTRRSDHALRSARESRRLAAQGDAMDELLPTAG